VGRVLVDTSSWTLNEHGEHSGHEAAHCRLVTSVMSIERSTSIRVVGKSWFDIYPLYVHMSTMCSHAVRLCYSRKTNHVLTGKVTNVWNVFP
jgi:hypothetical protein